MNDNILDLSKIESKDLINELSSRGYFTDLLYSIHDVDMQLDNINESREGLDNQIVLTKEQKIEVINECFNLDYYSEQMNSDIEDLILNRYD